jgi:hypothetical protein
MASISPTNMVTILKFSYVSGFLLVWGVTLTKISIACMLLRLRQSTAWTWSLLTAIFILVATGIIFTCFVLTQCNPIRANWDVVLDPSLALKCGDPRKLWAVSVFTSGIYIAQVTVY